MDFSAKGTILITCARGLAAYLRAELAALNHDIISEHPGGIEIKGSLTDAMKLNLELRTAYNVLYLLKNFSCDTTDQLYKHTFQIDWENIIPPDEYLSIVSRVDTPAINNTMFPNLKVKDAIVDRIMKHAGSRPDSGPDRDKVVIHLYWKDDKCWLYLNTSGVKLSDRGYRQIPLNAPMRESLAAAVIIETQYDGTANLINPMCGSGTLAIEAALIAMNRSPGLLRSNFGFKHIKGFDEQAWSSLRKDAQKTRKKTIPAKIIATDIDPAAIDAAKKNAMTAGVDHLIEFSVCDFAETPLPQEKGTIIINPEYGFRLGDTKNLEETYQRIGDFFKQQCKGFTGYVFTGNMELAKKIGLRTSRRAIFFNGDIECRLLKYELYEGSKKQKYQQE